MRAVLPIVLAVIVAATAAPAAGAIEVVGSEKLDARLREYRLRTPALPGPTTVRVLLPDGYAERPHRRYPVLYLLHGCCDSDVDGSQAWTTHGEAEQATAGKPLIVVMPAGGRGGLYSDWANAGSQGRPQWETYHVRQLIPWIDARFRTRAARAGRVIAGLSMGGFGAMKYAATYPDRFIAAASFSGAVDSNFADGAVHGVLPSFDGGDAGSVWGPRATSEIRWRSENPWDLAANLRPLTLTILTGNGEPGPLDAPGATPDPIEAGVRANSVSLHHRLTALGIAHRWDDYGPGTHTWPYWARDLRQTLPALLAVLRHPPRPPARVSYRSALPSYSVFGWRVAWHRGGLAFTRLVRASRRGFTLEGRGTAVVRTPAGFSRCPRVTVDGAAVSARADRRGRLAIRARTGSDGKARVRIRSGSGCR
ncbi:MAG: esterase family protein [Thermoleophilaceae bacterium]|nr:esterase family protein [Thermoleophilaceae bacterium]